ncbi:MAG: sigma-54 dependent transcriptional regulator [Terriglobia bacterium]|nr:sigma-54 dependent transcriptional regulator [Terriglobia bacterium]
MRSSAALSQVPDASRLAVVSPDETAWSQLESILSRSFQLRRLLAWEHVIPVMAEFPMDGLVVDIDNLGRPQMEVLASLEELRRANRDIVIVTVTRLQDRSLRLRAAEIGCDEFFVAPIDLEEMRIVLERSLGKRFLEIENRRATEQISGGRYGFSEIIGRCEPMLRVFDTITRVARSDTSVVIRGESGTGKELVAKSIVALSPRKDRAFISLNCAALPDSLIESELFGYEKGAFTGAHAPKPGQIELANGGTLFLDEIATLGTELQTKLLRVLQERSVQRLGSKSSRKIDFRLLTATNENLEEMVRTGRFREDLYYRIHVVPIFMPPLRERREDVSVLANHFLRIYCGTNRIALKRLDPEVLNIFEDYAWPGNVREMENLIQRLILMVEGPLIRARDLPDQMLLSSAASHESLLIPEEGIDFDDEIARIEVAYLEAALRRTAGRKVAAAKLLHIKQQKMKYLCRKYKIKG